MFISLIYKSSLRFCSQFHLHIIVWILSFFLFRSFSSPDPSVEMYSFIKAAELNLTVSPARLLLQNLNHCFITFAFSGGCEHCHPSFNPKQTSPLAVLEQKTHLNDNITPFYTKRCKMQRGRRLGAGWICMHEKGYNGYMLHALDIDGKSIEEELTWTSSLENHVIESELTSIHFLYPLQGHWRARAACSCITLRIYFCAHNFRIIIKYYY